MLFTTRCQQSKPWREACYRIAGTLINMAEKCQGVAVQCAKDEELIFILIESWGGVRVDLDLDLHLNVDNENENKYEDEGEHENENENEGEGRRSGEGRKEEFQEEEGNSSATSWFEGGIGGNTEIGT